MIIYLKSQEDVYEPRQVDIIDWLKENTEKDGTLIEDVIFRGGCQVKVDGNGILWTLSDMTLDSDMERIDPAGWDLKAYKANPIVLWSHDIFRPAIGVIKNVRKSADALTGRVVFDTSGMDPLAEQVASKVQQGIITKGSVGFRSLQIEVVADEKKPERLIHRKQELMEFSIVNVPANPNASVQLSDEIEDAKADIPDSHYIDQLGAGDTSPDAKTIASLFPVKTDIQELFNED